MNEEATHYIHIDYLAQGFSLDSGVQMFAGFKTDQESRGAEDLL